ncbi:hypothetical protein [Floridanema evergladense]|uniref:Uncharacterized protein n=1 Tax=Floridaenema evergladense BLCC-F167 TaxID=3153639 RepID=A0ABV4WVG4_9CYAN
MGLTLNLVTLIAAILGLQVINICAVTAAPVNVPSLIRTRGYEPPNQGGPDSSQGSGTR